MKPQIQNLLTLFGTAAIASALVSCATTPAERSDDRLDRRLESRDDRVDYSLDRIDKREDARMDRWESRENRADAQAEKRWERLTN